MPNLRLSLFGVPLTTVILTCAIGAVGALVAWGLRLPLPFLLGSLLAVAGIAASGARPFGRSPGMPQKLRMWFIPIIGVAIGGTFTPDLLAGVGGWWPSVLGLVVFIPVAHWCSYQLFLQVGGLSPQTSFYAAVPGGLIEAIAMGEDAGADMQMLTMLQFLRLILSIVLVPLIFTILTGAAVGSASGAQLTNGAAGLSLSDVALLVAAGVVGYFVGNWLRLPGGAITGPIIFSGLAHLAGLTHAVPPGWMIALTQLIVGVSLGVRFLGLPRGTFGKAFRLALLNAVMTLCIGFLFALALHSAVGEKTGTVFLAFAPGGVAEMSLVALSLQVSVIYVTTHHVLRILLSVLIAQLFAHRVR
ncbi:AbrB family transcriptional regulator [Plastorhodobacter daqingensis]|uniref:AbrB family transcriptional regulator n=1 Tax=Plastorhodobacter daqingensis TaxID=1387281 RepID=A0ABW2UKY8_9RHOB